MTFVDIRPELTAFHVAPVSAERKTPPPNDPAKIVPPLTAKAVTSSSPGQLVFVQRALAVWVKETANHALRKNVVVSLFIMSFLPHANKGLPSGKLMKLPFKLIDFF
jgi:hypothetical protein